MFQLTEEQRKKLNEWLANRPQKKAYTGAIGGRYTYTFTPTGLGTVVKVKDAIVGDEIDLSDYEHW